MGGDIDGILSEFDRNVNRVKTAESKLKWFEAAVNAMYLRHERDDYHRAMSIAGGINLALRMGKYDDNPELKIRAFNTLELALCVAGFWDFDVYLQALEFRRPFDTAFYACRRNTLKPVADAVTDLIVNDKYDILVLNMPPRVGKSTLGIVACSWVGGREPEKQSILTGYASFLTDSFYKELNTITTEDEYNYLKCFPGLRRVGQSAEKTSIDYTYTAREEMVRYPTWVCRAIGGSLNGQVEAKNLLYCDDLTRGYEETLSLDQMDKLYGIYSADLVGRAKEGFKTFHIGTRWSVKDVLGRVIDENEDNPRFKHISLPALDPVTEESNFVFPGSPEGIGFSTSFYTKRRRSLYADVENNGAVTWQCLYQQTPVERGSLVFPASELKYIDSLDFLEQVRIDESFTFVDVAFGGKDSLSMPIGLMVNGLCIIADWLHIKADYKITQPMVYAKLRQYGISRATFEANNGGDFYANDVQKMCEKDNHEDVFIVKKLHTGNQRKLDRIEAHAPKIKEFAFLSEKCYNSDSFKGDRSMYRAAMRELTSFSRTGNNRNDDAPDSLAGLAASLRSSAVSEAHILDRRGI